MNRESRQKVAMVTGLVFLCSTILCAGAWSSDQASPAHGTASHTARKAKKAAPPPLPSGPTGPIQQIPLDSIAPVPPQVSYQNGQLTIVAPNSTLADILRAVRKQTGADIDVPAAPERVATHLGPGPARDVVADLLNGSRFNYVLLGSPEDQSLLTRVVLVAKAPETGNQAGLQQRAQAGNPPPPPDANGDAADAEPADDNNAADDSADQAAQEAEQQQQQADQPGVKTPQQMLQEMQQRQLQLQQQQPPGQPPIPGAGRPPGAPQDQ